MFKDRLRKSLDDNGLRAVDLANFLGKNKTTVHSYLTGKAFPSMEMLVKISEFLPEVNIHWLVTGNGDQVLVETEKAPQEVEEPISTAEVAAMRKELDRLRRDAQRVLSDQDKLSAMLGAIEKAAPGLGKLCSATLTSVGGKMAVA